MDVALFDFDLPEERIALRPASPRDSARMLVVHGDGRLEHRHARDLPGYLNAGDALVVNDTKVIAARLRGQRLRSEGPAKIEIPRVTRLRVRLAWAVREIADRGEAATRPKRSRIEWGVEKRVGVVHGEVCRNSTT